MFRAHVSRCMKWTSLRRTEGIASRIITQHALCNMNDMKKKKKSSILKNCRSYFRMHGRGNANPTNVNEQEHATEENVSVEETREKKMVVTAVGTSEEMLVVEEEEEEEEEEELEEEMVGEEEELEEEEEEIGDDPVLKHTHLGSDEHMQFASTSMQGGRERMEDRHVCMLDAFERCERDLFRSKVTSRPWYYYSDGREAETVPPASVKLDESTGSDSTNALEQMDSFFHSIFKTLSFGSSAETATTAEEGEEEEEDLKPQSMDLRYHPKGIFEPKPAPGEEIQNRKPVKHPQPGNFSPEKQEQIAARVLESFGEFSNNYNLSFFGVFDGHGNDHCSRFVSRRLLPAIMVRECTRTTTWLRLLDSDRAIVESFLSLDRHFMERYPNEFSGSAAAGVFIMRPLDTEARIGLTNSVEIICANAGDARCILYHNNETCDISVDHRPNLPEEYERITKAGGFVNNFDLPRVNGILALTRSFGDQFLKNNPSLPMESQVVVAVPEISRSKLDFMQDTSSFSFIVLASDGVWDMMSSTEVTEFIVDKLRKQRAKYEQEGLQQSQYDFDLAAITEALVDEVAFSTDNISVIIVLFKKDGMD